MTNQHPKTGDVVVCISGFEIGQIGVLEGMLDRHYDSQMVCFNANAYRDDRKVTCGGGSAFYVLTKQLIPTDITVERRFWRFKDGIAGAGRGEDYILPVKVWGYKAERPNEYFPDTTVEKVLNKANSVLAFRESLTELQYQGLGDSTKLIKRGDFNVNPYRQSWGDVYGEKILAAYDRFNVLYVTTKDVPGSAPYVVVGDGFAFSSIAEYHDFLNAYRLVVKKGHWPNQSVIIPNNDFSAWEPLVFEE